MLSRHVVGQDTLFLQPRMGMGSLEHMLDGVSQVKKLPFQTVGTITLDSYTRCGELAKAAHALKVDLPLNGFPVFAYPQEVLRERLEALMRDGFTLQMRHGTPLPQSLFERMMAVGIFVSEGGPISYCLPYGRVPLEDAARSWEAACQMLATRQDAHMESFGGCLMGQLCPPSLLLAVNILEGIFFERAGLQDISFSYAQQYNICQDLAAMRALHRLASAYLAPTTHWHSVVYTFMGFFPQTKRGHRGIVRDSVFLARKAGAKRLIVKTKDEAASLPTLASNLEALGQAWEDTLALLPSFDSDLEEEENLYQEAKTLIDAVLNLNPHLTKAISLAFEKGILDIPFCLHPNNARQSACGLSEKGYLFWEGVGNMPITPSKIKRPEASKTLLPSENFLRMLAFNRLRYDGV